MTRETLTENTDSLIETYKTIRRALQLTGIDFFWAGGGVVDMLQGVAYHHLNDIDLFFYTEDDYEEAIEMTGRALGPPQFQTENATTFHKNVRIQLIKRNFGTPEEIFSGFDISKSRVAIGKRGIGDIKIHVDPSFAESLHVDYDNFRTSTPGRVLKYNFEKNFPVDDATYTEIISFLGSTDQEFQDYYQSEEITLDGKGLLAKMVMYSMCQYVPLDTRDMIIDHAKRQITNEDTSFFKWVVDRGTWEHFKEYPGTAIAHYKAGISESCVSDFYGEDMLIRIRDEYPEYFI